MLRIKLETWIALKKLQHKRNNPDPYDDSLIKKYEQPMSSAVPCHFERYLELPRPEVQKFDGNLQKYCAFFKEFLSF